MPIPGEFWERCGISRSARQVYYDKVREIAQRHDCLLADFADHDGDADFLMVPRNHLTPKGWMFYNRALDNFFHGRDLEKSSRAIIAVYEHKRACPCRLLKRRKRFWIFSFR